MIRYYMFYCVFSVFQNGFLVILSSLSIGNLDISIVYQTPVVVKLLVLINIMYRISIGYLYVIYVILDCGASNINPGHF